MCFEELLDELTKTHYVPHEDMRKIMELYEKSLSKDALAQKRRKGVIIDISKLKLKKKHSLLSPHSKRMTGVPIPKTNSSNNLIKLLQLKSKEDGRVI